MINSQTVNKSTSPIITENERQLKQLQKWIAYGEDFLNGEDSERNITDLKSKLVPDTILVFNMKEGQFEVVSGRDILMITFYLELHKNYLNVVMKKFIRS